MKRALLTGSSVLLALLLAGTAQAGVVKTKTKSNQSNDRIAQVDLAAALAAEFDRCDANHDGQLDRPEQAALVGTEFPAAEDAARGAPLKGIDIRIGRDADARSLHVLFSSGLDRDGNGLIARAEWLDDAAAQFALADGDHDGSLSVGEATRFGWNVKSTEVR